MPSSRRVLGGIEEARARASTEALERMVAWAVLQSTCIPWGRFAGPTFSWLGSLGMEYLQCHGVEGRELTVSAAR